MTPTIEYPQDWTLGPAVQTVLQQMFHDYAQVRLQKEFTEGQSGTHVLLAALESRGQGRELPAVVKIGPAELIQQEVSATPWVQHKLAGFVALAGEPMYVETTAGRYGGLRYGLAGDGIFRTESLRTYSRHATPAELREVLEQRLFPQLATIWGEDGPRQTRPVHASYDRVLPVNLLVQPISATAHDKPALVLDAAQLPDALNQLPPVQRNTLVRLENFTVTEIERHQQNITLNVPRTGELRPASFRVRVQGVPDLAAYALEQPAPPLVGRVLATRQELLFNAARAVLDWSIELDDASLSLPDNPAQRLPNPLLGWGPLLQQLLPMKIGVVHGDLNMGNVLVDPQVRTTQIIDCAHARRDHALYDLLRLEVETLLHPLAAALFRHHQPPTYIYQLYQWLDRVSRAEAHDPGHFALPRPLQDQLPALCPPFIPLTLIRNAARAYLATREDWQEYYTGLTLCLLGALKFASLDRAPTGQQPKAIAFWGAATALQLLAQPANRSAASEQWVNLTVNDLSAAPGEQKLTPAPSQIDNRSGGVYFEGNQSVQIEGDIIGGGTVNKPTFHGPVTGPVHTGSGHILVNSPTPAPVGPKRMTNIWYLDKEYAFWQVRNPDVGTLTLGEQSVDFQGRKHAARMVTLQEVTHGHQPGDLNNNWVKVRYTDEAGVARLALFANAKKLGIGNLIGGSDEIFQALSAWKAAMEQGE